MFKSNFSQKQKENLVITPDITIRDALVKINLNHQKCLTVIDKTKKLIGIISDGNIRRGLLKDLKLEDQIKNIYSKKNIIFFYKKNFTLKEAKKKLIENYHNTYIGIIPVIDDKKKIIDFVTLDESHIEKKTKKKTLTKTVVMAGGLGLIGTGLKTKQQGLQALTKAAEEESRNEVMVQQIEGQMAAAEMSQGATLTSAGAATGAYLGGAGGALIGAAAGYLFSKLI
jgi:CBS domain-containing protein